MCVSKLVAILKIPYLRLLRHLFALLPFYGIYSTLFFIPALIGIMKLASTTIAFFWLPRVPWRLFLFRCLLGQAVNLWFFRLSVRVPVPQITCIAVVYSIAVANSIAFLNSIWLSASNLCCMHTWSFTPQTSRSRSIFSSWSLNSQCSYTFSVPQHIVVLFLPAGVNGWQNFNR